MSVYRGPLCWYGFKTFSTREQAEMHQAILAMQGVYTTVRGIKGVFILYPATEDQINGLLKQVDGAK